MYNSLKGVSFLSALFRFRAEFLLSGSFRFPMFLALSFEEGFAFASLLRSGGGGGSDDDAAPGVSELAAISPTSPADNDPFA